MRPEGEGHGGGGVGHRVRAVRDDKGIVVVPLVVDEPGEPRPVLRMDVDAVQAERFLEVGAEVVEDLVVLLLKLLLRDLHNFSQRIGEHADGAASIDDEQAFGVRGGNRFGFRQGFYQAVQQALRPVGIKDASKQRGCDFQFLGLSTVLMADEASGLQKGGDGIGGAGLPLRFAEQAFVEFYLGFKRLRAGVEFGIPEAADVADEMRFRRIGALVGKPRGGDCFHRSRSAGIVFHGLLHQFHAQAGLAARVRPERGGQCLRSGLAEFGVEAGEPACGSEVAHLDGGSQTDGRRGVRRHQVAKPPQADEGELNAVGPLVHEGAKGVGQFCAEPVVAHVLAIGSLEEAVDFIEHDEVFRLRAGGGEGLAQRA